MGNAMNKAKKRLKLQYKGATSSIYVYETNSKDEKRNMNVMIRDVVDGFDKESRRQGAIPPIHVHKTRLGEESKEARGRVYKTNNKDKRGHIPKK